MALKWVAKPKTGHDFLQRANQLSLEAEPEGQKPSPVETPTVPDSSGPEGAGAFSVGPWAGAGLLVLSQAAKEAGTASYFFPHSPHSALELDRPRRLPLAGLAAKSFRLFIFVGVSRDTLTTYKALISMPNDFHAASGEHFNCLEWHNCALPCNIYCYWLSFFKYATGFRGFWPLCSTKERLFFTVHWSIIYCVTAVFRYA